MVSNHFPLVYGGGPAWIAVPAAVLAGCVTGLSLEWIAGRRRRVQARE